MSELKAGVGVGGALLTTPSVTVFPWAIMSLDIIVLSYSFFEK